jgi:hypothetical protein
MKNSSRVVGALMTACRLVAQLWRQLGEIDRVLERRRIVPDCEHARATAIFRDSLIVRALARLTRAWNPSDSSVVAALAPAKSRFEQFERWQQVRLVGIVITSGFTVHALLWVVLPTRFAPNLPAAVWILAATVGVVCIVASRTIAAAWDDWHT